MVATDCWNYPSIKTKEDYSKFVSDCAGVDKLGFMDDIPWVFDAQHVSENDFNKLFSNAKEIRMSIHIQNTNFVQPSLEKLQKVHVREGSPSFRFENNADLVDLKTPTQTITSEPNDTVVETYYFGNGRGKDMHVHDTPPYANVHKLCPVKKGCRVHKDTECSRIAEPINDISEFVDKCSNETVIKGAPGVKVMIDLALLNSRQISKLFGKSEQLYICIRSVGTYHRKLRFPHLKHIEACNEGENALLLENNPFLEEVVFPCTFTSDRSFRIRGNHILSARNIMAMLATCLQCDLQDPGENLVESADDIKADCENFPPPEKESDYIHLVNTCSGVQKLQFAGGTTTYFDASKLPQYMFEELFKKIEEINFGLKIVNTQYKRLYIPNLKKINIFGKI
ncbi:unnamed protein product [Strongylus vulgaris]|uniref:Receptor L-domain domain-containing protein n=1 Tax=Strongylus vulgaris TaxID=40348 RepID=A0A3P7K1X3_STRVU|nr:unnamed protein product [Strongylus vulgaris]